ncbi:PD-(D/E)XK nuclease family protein [uncultured Oxalicibacterium sp.]|uniref:PD-(D/E)XK nuclease family protein n=1 Tax=uncultured Oxalicibacterium sp. TaxID=1168540 RepID=UPI0025EDE4E5|nr:PD-(D/E)XK nuclease family protein [uncultured Oxalicibacterium sp.]
MNPAVAQPIDTVYLPSSARFWDEAARTVLGQSLPDYRNKATVVDLSGIRVLVSTFEHIQLLRQALAREVGRAFIPPVIMTPGAAIGMLPPSVGVTATASSERLMMLYASLRQHGWLKKLFTARRNTDLLPLAETLLTLSDELTQTWLPALQGSPDAADAQWQAALAQLSPQARTLLSDETQLVWTIWKSQLDASDAIALRFARMRELATHADQPLFWISPVAADAMEQAFLAEWQARQHVTIITLDWRAAAIAPIWQRAWQEVAEHSDEQNNEQARGDEQGMMCEHDQLAHADIATPGHLQLFEADSLEDEARGGAQAIIAWLQQGLQHIAIVAQDRVVARRMRALLERAQIQVADETGWKLSTTRAAAAVAAWAELVASQAETVGLLDFLKSPFVFAELADKGDQLIFIETVLHRANVLGGWDAVVAACARAPEAQWLLQRLRAEAMRHAGRRRLCNWLADTRATFDAIGMTDALLKDEAGRQVLDLFDLIERDCAAVDQDFSFAEWRAFLNLQLEATAFVQPRRDKRVVMLPLNGARLRSFDAVLLVGADAEHLPSRPVETLFFANAVRAELGLATRESRQRQQLRDVVELLSANPRIIMSWQAHRNGEPNLPSPWLQRLELVLQQAGLPLLVRYQPVLPLRSLTTALPRMPAPAAPLLRPQKLSASGYNSLVACPYQFFATRMLRLSGLDELSELPEKRDYGDWLHRILALFHESLRDHPVSGEARAALLQAISDRVFGEELQRSAAALGFQARWQKNMPAYLEWVAAREAEGWQFMLGEEQAQKVLQWAEGSIVLHGRIDRIDADAQGAQVVLDYKSTSAEVLKKRLDKGEDQQLPFYGLLSPTPLAGAAYVPLEQSRERIAEVAAEEFDAWQRALEQRIVASMQAIDRGAAMPASGPASVCQYCDVRGLCRKGAW